VGSPAAIAPKTCPRCGGAFDPDAVFCPKDGTRLHPEAEELPPDSDPYIGTVISGDIELRAVAGAGAMGRVYRAHQKGIERDVAVKILHRELSGNTQLVQRFHREAKIASKLQHPHVVEVYLAGQLPDRALYIVMEYLDGMSLAAAMAAAGGAMPIERALTIALQICDAVGEGHARGIVHRDLKPENVMLVRRAEASDWVKVLDFGIAKVSIGEQSMETAAGLIFGTARYISPEGAQGTTVGPQGDVYSLAVMVYQMLSGHTPFDAEQPVGLLIKHIHETPPALTSWPAAAAVPAPVAQVIMDNLAKDPTRRASSARAFASALAAAAREANVSFSDVGVVARMSMVDLGVARPKPTIEPTLDDAAAQLGFSVAPAIPAGSLAPTPSNPENDRTQPSNPPSAGAAPAAPAARVIVEPAPADASASARVSAAARSAEPSQRPEPKRSFTVIILAFLLGVALTGLAFQTLSNRKDAAIDAHVARARLALTQGHYTTPPGDNVRDLVASGLARWPDEVRLVQVKSDAAHELVTRAMAARSSGDVGQARDLAKSALEFDPTDHAAKILLDQYDDELGQAGAGGLGAPKVLLDVPVGRSRQGQKIELTARIIVGGAAPRSAVNNPRFTVSGAGLKSPLIIPGVPAEGGLYRASFTAPRSGEIEVVFEANTDGMPLRAEHTIEVSP